MTITRDKGTKHLPTVSTVHGFGYCCYMYHVVFKLTSTFGYFIHEVDDFVLV